ncbi:DUF3667 domain-containing protein [Rubrivirga sp.]|uniref:DUF3667 domain-containing protein n=1 Tax=Rubrivirga sp. TaxID=1885344 RepID=UPI003B51C233
MDPLPSVETPPAPANGARPACLDCGTPLVGPYCHGCGQRDQPPDLPVRHIVADALGDALAWDGRVLQTARTLLRQPGALAVDWASGRRSRHVAPFRLYLLCSLLFVGVSAGYELAKDALVPVTETAEEDAAQLRDNLRGGIPQGKTEAVARYIEGMVGLGVRWMFVLMPLGGFGLYVLYGLRRRSYAAHFVLAIHVFCVVVLLLAVRRLIQLAVTLATGDTLAHVNGTINTLVILAVFAASYVYATLSIRRFYGVSTIKAIASAPAVTVGPVVAWIALLLTGMFLILAWP